MMQNQHNENLPTLQEGQDSNGIPTRPIISATRVEGTALKNICPQHAIGVNPDRIDLGKCNFCRQCELEFPDKITFTGDASLATNVRDRLIILERDNHSIGIDKTTVRPEIKKSGFRTIALYAVSDTPFITSRTTSSLGRQGIFLSTKAFECSGLLLTGNILSLPSEELTNIYSQLRAPKIIVVSGMAAIAAVSGNSSVADFFNNHTIDLYVPGDPADPDTLGRGIAELIRS